MATQILSRLLWLGFLGSLFLFGQKKADRSIVHLRDLAKTPSVITHAPQSLILDAHPDDPAESAIRYELEAGKHSFCLAGNDRRFTRLVLNDETGNTNLAIPGFGRCLRVTLPKGLYTLHVSRSVDTPPDPTQFGAVEVDLPGPPLVDTNGNPAGGFWAIGLTTDELYTDRLTAQLPSRFLGQYANNAMPLVIDASSVIDAYSLFSFPPNSQGNHHPVLLAPGFFLDVLQDTEDGGEINTMIAGNYECGGLPICDFFGNGSDTTNLIDDLGYYQFAFETKVGNSLPFNFSVQPTAFSNQTLLGSSSPATPMSVLFRFYPDGTQIGTLNEGEAALFEKPNYQGKAAVVAVRGFDAASYNSDDTTLANSLVSVKVGNNTVMQVNFYDGGGDSQPVTLFNDTPLLPNPIDRVFWISALDEFVPGAAGEDPSFACPQCQLVGTNLSAFTLVGANWQQADMSQAVLSGTQFTSGTNLTGAKFIGATLNGVSIKGSTTGGTDFTGAKLTCVDFSGTDSNHLADLTQAIMANVQWFSGSSCLNNLAYTKVSLANVPPSAWRNIDLTGAVFVDLKPGVQLSSKANPVNMTGAKLAGVSLQQVVLDYAVLTKADLTQTLLNTSSLQHANLSGAQLYGASLNHANLDGANMSGAYLTKSLASGQAATLEGTFLRNVNLSQAQLSGADFSYASFYSTVAAGTGTCTPNPKTGFTSSCATAANAILNNTQFPNAYLFGVDFTSAQIQGVQFSDAVLAGANFNGATISVDSSVGTNSGFSAAFLQGTNLPDATLQGVSLADAFVDFSSSGNTAYVILSGDHTVFPGYWNKQGESVCAEMSYPGPSVVPPDNVTITCPDGGSGACGNPFNPGNAPNIRWNSRVDIAQATYPASYQFSATFTPAATTPICTQDPLWVGSGVGAAPPMKPHPKPKPHHFDPERGDK